VTLPSDLPRVSLRNPTDDEIEETVEALEDNRDARRAIENAGLSVKDFVLTSLALGQALTFPDRARVLIPGENVVFVERNRADVERARSPRVRVFIVDDDDDDDDDDDRRRRSRGRDGRGRGGDGSR
jgi:hypothetical protein